MSFLDTLTKKLGFTPEETPKRLGGASPFVYKRTPDRVDRKALTENNTGFLAAIARSIPRSAATVGETIKQGLFSRDEDIGVKEIPKNKVSQLVFGQEPIRTIPKLTEKYKPEVKAISEKFGASEQKAESISKFATLPIVIGSIALDLTGFGGGTKRIAKEGLEEFTKIAVREEGEQILKESAKKLLNVSDEEAAQIAKTVSPLKKQDEIYNAIGVKQDLPDELVEFSDTVVKKNIPKDEYVRRFENDLKNQNLTFRDRAQATEKVLKENGFSIESFYDDIIERSKQTSIENTNKFRNEVYQGLQEAKRLDTPDNINKYLLMDALPDDTVMISRASKKPIGNGDSVVLNKGGERYLEQRPGSEFQSMEVPVKDLVKANGRPDEFIYNPKIKTPTETDVVVSRTPENTVNKIQEPDGTVIFDTTKKAVDDKVSFGSVEPATPEKLKTYGKLRQGVSDIWTRAVEKFQNNTNRIEKIVNNPKANVTEETNPVLSRILYSGRLQSRLENINKEVSTIIEDTVKKSKEVGVKYETFKEEVNDYLHALHAPERNAQLGPNAAGITDDEAKAMLDSVTASPHFKQIKEVADSLLELNKKTLDILYADGRVEGVITKDVYDNLRNIYKNHIPLNRIFGETENINDIITSRGFDVRGSGLKRAKGSAREIDDIMGNITSNVMSATQRAEKNIVDNATYDFIKNNPDMDFARIVTDPQEIGRLSAADQTVMQFRRNGKDVYIKFNDPLIAGQFKNTIDQQMPPLLNFIGAFTRFYSGLSTRFNPEFFVSNKIRDIQEAMIYAGSEKKLGAKGALGTFTKEARLQNERAIYDYLAGKDTEGASLYKEMMDEGGTTGGMALSTKRNITEDIKKIETIAQSKPRQALEKIVGSIDTLNEVFENSTRLSVYRQAKEMGLSNKESARMAKESTVNFNRKGSASPIINSLYMFSNASIQGSAKMIKAMKNPKVLASVASIVGTSVWNINRYNDSVDEDWKEKVNKFDRSSNMVVVLNGGDKDEFKYITIPVSYALKPFKVAFDGIYDIATNTKDVDAKKVIETTMAAILDGYNPLGGTSLGSALIPTIADIPAEIGLNKKWTGSKIGPDANPDLPDSRQYFDSLKNTTLGRFSIALTKKLSDKNIAEISPANMAYAITQYSGGAGKFVSKTINTVDQATGDEPIKLDELPFVSRFYKKYEGDELESIQTQSSKDAPLIKDIRQEGAKKNFDEKQIVKETVSEFNLLETKEEKRDYLLNLSEKDEAFAKKVIDELKVQKKDFKQKQYESLQIKNGERAMFISEKLKTMTREEKKVFLQDLAERKILTEEVIKQLKDNKY